MSAVRSWLAACLISAYRLRPKGGVREFAESEVFIPKSESNDLGGRMYSTAPTPWVRLVMWFATAPEWREFIGPKSSQSGMTLAVLIVVLYYIKHRLGNVLYAIDSVVEARRISKSRLKPLIKACRTIAAELAEKEDDLTNLTYFLEGMVVYLIGAFSEGAWQNKTLILAVLDELDRHELLPSGATTIDAARQRLKRQEAGKLIGFGTPEGELDVTWQEFLSGSRHKLHLPCPRCGHEQELVLEGLDAAHCKDLLGEYDLARVERETVYRCCACGTKIEEHEKPGMLAAVADHPLFGFVPTNHGQDEHKPVPGRMSAHISDLYSTFPTSTWGIIMREYLEAQRSPAKLKDFYNGRLGLPRPEQRTEVKGDDIRAMCGTYAHGTCPVRPACVIMTVDVQKDVKKWTKTAFTAKGEAYVLDYGFTLSYDELLAVADDPIPIEGTNETVTVDFGLIDEGHDTMNVREFCQSSQGLFHPCKGRSGAILRDVVDQKTGFRQNGQEITIFHFSDDDFKSDLYLTRIGKHKAIVKGQNRAPRLWFMAKPDADFVSELCQEKRVQVMKKGRLQWVWDDPKAPNDFGDTVKYALVAWYVVKKFYIEQVSPDLAADEVYAVPLVEVRVRPEGIDLESLNRLVGAVALAPIAPGSRAELRRDAEGRVLLDAEGCAIVDTASPGFLKLFLRKHPAVREVVELDSSPLETIGPASS